MNVLIDASGISKKKAGVGVYAKNLIEELTNIHPGPHFFVLAQDDDPELNFGSRHNVTMIWVPARLFRLLPLRFLLEQVFVPFLLIQRKIDIIHSLHYSFPLLHFGSKQFVTVHDMTFFNMPEVHTTVKIAYFRIFIRAAVRFADKLIFVSHSALQDCVARFGSLRASSTVIHLGKSSAFTPDLDPAEIDRVRKKYGLPAEYVLYVGTIEPRKNLSRLISAFATVCEKHPDLSLVIAGMHGWMYNDLMDAISNLKMASRVIFTGFIPEEEKPFLIAASKVFTYPSLYEGFGIPVLEALACGIPTLTSNVSSLPEVVGHSALMIDPQSVPEISSAMERLLSDQSLRNQLRRDGLQQAAKFTWVKTATMTLREYQKALSSNNKWRADTFKVPL